MEVKVLLAITVLEILALVVVLGIYLAVVARQLNNVASYLAKVTFGVRAIESQCSVIGPTVTDLNATLADVAAALPGVAQKAERLTRV
jgi:hypothetical protein